MMIVEEIKSVYKINALIDVPESDGAVEFAQTESAWTKDVKTTSLAPQMKFVEKDNAFPMIPLRWMFAQL